MHKLLFILFSILAMNFSVYAQNTLQYEKDIEVTKKKSIQDGKQILLVFAGSDWCKPCVVFEKEVLQNSDFIEFAKDSLHIVYADFPSKKKNQLDSTQALHNDKLAEKYNPEGIFPKVLLITNTGEIINKIETYNMTAQAFINACKKE